MWGTRIGVGREPKIRSLHPLSIAGIEPDSLSSILHLVTGSDPVGEKQRCPDLARSALDLGIRKTSIWTTLLLNGLLCLPFLYGTFRSPLLRSDERPPASELGRSELFCKECLCRKTPRCQPYSDAPRLRSGRRRQTNLCCGNK